MKKMPSSLKYSVKHLVLMSQGIEHMDQHFLFSLTNTFYRLNQFQIVFICEIKMGSIMKALKTFVSWLQSGLYDFSSFSVVLKEELSEDHVKLLRKLKNEAISKGRFVQLI